MPNSLFYYYIERFNTEFINCNKRIEYAEDKKSQYFIRYIHTAHLLKMEGKTEYEKRMLEKRLDSSLKHYATASSFIKDNIKNVSNRTIVAITGFSRSCVDRACLSAIELLSEFKMQEA